MRLPKESKKRIKEAYIGDLFWLNTIEEELEKYKKNELIKSDLEYDYEEYDKIIRLINTLYQMNYVIIETETTDYAEKYYDNAHELYAEMKVDLTEMIGYEDMWEEI